MGDRVSFEWLNWTSTGGKATQVCPHERATGSISSIAKDKGYAIVREDPSQNERPVMLKHLRRLVKKKRREFWIFPNDTGGWYVESDEPVERKRTRVREVKP